MLDSREGNLYVVSFYVLGWNVLYNYEWKFYSLRDVTERRGISIFGIKT